MARRLQREGRPPLRDRRAVGLEIVGKLGRCFDEIELRQDLHPAAQLLRPLGDVGGELLQHAALLLRSHRLGNRELVAEPHQLLRLDEERLPRIRGVVHDARDLRLVGGVDRHDVAIVADGDVIVAHPLAEFALAHDLFEAALDLVVQRAGLVAERGEHPRGAVLEASGRFEGRLDPRSERRRLRQFVAHRREDRDLGAVTVEEAGARGSPRGSGGRSRSAGPDRGSPPCLHRRAHPAHPPRRRRGGRAPCAAARAPRRCGRANARSRPCDRGRAGRAPARGRASWTCGRPGPR